jgi:hypothetical protein
MFTTSSAPDHLTAAGDPESRRKRFDDFLDITPAMPAAR